MLQLHTPSVTSQACKALQAIFKNPNHWQLQTEILSQASQDEVLLKPVLDTLEGKAEPEDFSNHPMFVKQIKKILDTAIALHHNITTKLVEVVFEPNKNIPDLALYTEQDLNELVTTVVTEYHNTTKLSEETLKGYVYAGINPFELSVPQALTSIKQQLCQVPLPPIKEIHLKYADQLFQSGVKVDDKKPVVTVGNPFGNPSTSFLLHEALPLVEFVLGDGEEV